MGSRFAVVLALSAVSLSLSGAAEALAQRSRATEADPRVETMARMMRPVTLELTDTPVGDVLVFIEQVGGVTMDVKSLDSGAIDGIDLEEQVSVRIRGGSLLRLLELSLDKAETGFAEFTWQLTEYGELEVGPKTALNRSRFMKIYDVRDLLFDLPDFTDAPTLDLDSVLSQGEGGGGGGSIFEDDETEKEQETQQERMDQIIDIITTSIDPDQWQVNGGDGASLREYNGTLLINAPDYIHRQISGYDFWPAVERAARRYRDAAPTTGGTRGSGARSNRNMAWPPPGGSQPTPRPVEEADERSPVDDLRDAVDDDSDDRGDSGGDGGRDR